MTGHDNGLITISAGRGRRRRARAAAHGHGRALPHAAGPSPPRGRALLLGPAGAPTAAAFDEFRAMFGDERQDYGEALKAHYAARPAGRLGGALRQRLRQRASLGGLRRDLGALPAHRRHAGDRRARSGIRVDPHAARADDLSAEVDFDVYSVPGIEPIIDAWLPLSFAVNSLNRSMGHPDLYPFVLSARRDREAGLHPPPGAAGRTN